MAFWCQRHPKSLLSALALLLAAQISAYWYPTPDTCSYLSIARSIARGTGPTNLGSPHLWFPPGYPALLSPLFLAGDRPLLLASIFQWLLMVGLMTGCYVWARRVVPEAALWITALSVVNCILWIQYRRLLSETAFMCVFIWTANAMHAAVRTVRWPRVLAAAAGVAGLIGLLCVIRPVGLPLAAGFGLATFLAAWQGKMTWRRAAPWAALVLIAASATVAAVVARERATARAVGGRTYLNEFDDAARSFLSSYPRGIQLCISDIGRVTIPGMYSCYGDPGNWLDVNMVPYLPFLLLLLLGWWRWAKRDNDPLAWTLPFYVGLIAAHSFDTGGRHLVPMLPILLVCVWFALERLRQRRLAVLRIGLLIHLAVACGYWLTVDLPRAKKTNAHWAAVDALAAQLRNRPEPVVAQGLPQDMPLMLQLALDRPVLDGDSQPLSVPGVCWIASWDGQSETVRLTRQSAPEAARKSLVARQAAAHEKGLLR